ncbi:hypothetical protein LAZ67_2002865 [Cordylochernes scorpioides]|uniref:Uncharacterized protein n=1 Tax=Cordylochernes scorpioides TaxID=51811 RepID=A0ABY6K2E7_9ARAC|nr:hypothetical protein LAZ67_2002865 [Cordylochernes scorpioides]
MDAETEIRRIKRLGLNLEKLEKKIENNAADCFELDAILKKIEKIKQQYDNKKYFIFNLIQRIIDLPKLTIKSSTQLLFLVDNSCEVIRSLETLGYKLDELLKILSDKLDKTTKRSWNMTVDNNYISSCSELLKFKENHAKALNTNETLGFPLISAP